jgi:hypothetical protein
MDSTLANSANPLPKLTRKQKAFVAYLLTHPKASATEAVSETYGVSNRHSAEVVASENLRKPAILSVLNEKAEEAERTLTEVMDTAKSFSNLGNTAGANYAATSASIANSILDRLHGKAKQSIDVTSTSVNLNIDLS